MTEELHDCIRYSDNGAGTITESWQQLPLVLNFVFFASFSFDFVNKSDTVAYSNDWKDIIVFRSFNDVIIVQLYLFKCFLSL